MSLASSGNCRSPVKRDISAGSKGTAKCRIPLKVQNKMNINQSKPKSAGNIGHTVAPITPLLWANKPERLPPNSSSRAHAIKRMREQNKQARNSSVNPRVNGRIIHTYLPNQETLKKEQDEEVQDGLFSCDEFEPLRTEVNPEVEESVTSVRGKLVKLKISWQKQMDRFDNLKADLGLRQTELMKLYASICKTHKELLATGQTTVLPPPDDLSIMNVAKLTPEQLLQMCADADKETASVVKKKTANNDSLAVNKFYDVSSKLVDTCNEALEKRKGIIDWFDKLMNMANNPNAISVNKLNEKVREFNEENESLRQYLESVRLEFYSEMQYIVDYFRKAVNDAIHNQLHAEDLTCKLSELNARNLDLKKKLYSLEHTRINKLKIDELEKDLIEERRKKSTFKERADIAETQLKEKEQALEKLNEHAAGLEQTIQELNDQNQQLQDNFDKELNKLMDSITKNTKNLKEIAVARENLQNEKEHIERRYKEQTDQYIDEIKKLKHELNNEVDKRAETDKKYLEMLEKNKLLEPIVENMQKELMETDKRYAESIKKIKRQEEELNAMKEEQERLELSKQYEMEEIRKEIENYKSVIGTHNSTILRFEKVEKELMKELEDSKNVLGSKEQYIASLEIKQSYLEDQMRQSEEQLSKIKNDINTIQEAWGYFENLDQLNEMINQQRLKLDETTYQIKALKEELDKKESEMKVMKEKLEKQKHELNNKDMTVKTLAAKEEEHKNIIKLMKENFEMRTQTDAKLNRELAEKDGEISTLINALENTKEQVDQLKKMVHTLKDQATKQKHKDKEVITMLERKLADVESDNRRSISNSDNFDSLLQILENEIQFPYTNEERSIDGRRSHKRRFNREKTNKQEKYCTEDSPSSLFGTDQGPKATKIVMGNFVKKTYIANNKEDDDISVDLDQKKKGGAKVENQRWLPIRGPGIGAFEPSLMKKNRNETYNGFGNLDELKEKYLARNLQFVIPNLLQEEKQSRMFRFAKHRM